MATAADNSWSISVKAIGGALKRSADEGDCENFTVTVSPEDDLTSLYDQIEGVTGLKASQQRLIYRGRLIGASNNEEGRSKLEVADELPKIKDIVGLGDGQTIHLVRRQESQQSARPENEANASSTSSTTSPPSSSDRENDSLSGSGTASLLAALIGLGGLDGADSSEPATSGQRQRIGWRSSRLSRNRRPHYRLTAEDLEIPDPGSAEPVRQGLMTLHTLLPHARIESEEDSLRSPLNANRQWYRGQWIDCRDTVNQWLEATIVEIVMPDDILPPCCDRQIPVEKPSEIKEPSIDPAVSANDFDGRRQLLLEPCVEGDKDDEGGELSGFKRRCNNEGVQLLLIHYNGWPHRWDEWIRSDSERIRPFRTRTRHPTMSTHASPTPQSVFNEAPSTNIRSENDAVVERTSVLPEISRVCMAVNELLNSVITEETSNSNPLASQNDNTPWASSRNDNTTWADPISMECQDEPDEEQIALRDLGEDASDRSNERGSTNYRTNRDQRQYEMLAPLLDRLGRVLIDAAPHVASLSTASPQNDINETEASSQTGLSDSMESSPGTLGGLLSLLGRDRRRHSNIAVGSGPEPSDTNYHTDSIDPDYIDFATGFVNTSRGEVRTGPRGRGQTDDVAGLLGAYLAAASLGSLTSGDGSDNGAGGSEDNSNMMGLGRLLGERGNTGGGAGIDIHIHAVVTAPGVATGGGLGFATLGGAPVTNTTTRNILSASRERRGSGSLRRVRTPSVVEEDDTGLFSELYSENPAPINPNVSEENETNLITVDDDPERSEYNTQSDVDFLSRLTSSRQSPGLPIARTDSFSVAPSRLSRSSSDGSSRRDVGSSPRRSSMLGRLFRRSRRSNN